MINMPITARWLQLYLFQNFMCTIEGQNLMLLLHMYVYCEVCLYMNLYFARQPVCILLYF